MSCWGVWLDWWQVHLCTYCGLHWVCKFVFRVLQNHKQWIIVTIAQFSLWHVRTRIGLDIDKDGRKSGKMTSFDPSETDYGYPLYTYGQYYGGYPLYTHPPMLASWSVVESVPLSVTPGTTPGPGAVASVSLLLYCVRRIHTNYARLLLIVYCKWFKRKVFWDRL